ncbi:MAG: hypothetical protein EOP47_18365, partial [Sphingobacteriaceae bacterium]
MTTRGERISVTNPALQPGTWGEFGRQVAKYYRKTPGYDTTLNAPILLDPYTGQAILKKLTDTVKNLTVKLNTRFTAIKKDGTGWQVNIISNNKTITI